MLKTQINIYLLYINKQMNTQITEPITNTEFIISIIVMILALIILCVVVQHAFNMVMPHAIGAKKLDLKHAIALFILTSILVKGHCVCVNK